MAWFSIMPPRKIKLLQKMNKDSRLVYSTGIGRIKEPDSKQDIQTNSDGIIRIRRESKGRGGKTVSVVEGIPAEQQKAIGKLLKSSCATGGAVKSGNIEIQGDHRDTIKAQLEKKGFSVKLLGG